MLFLFLPLVASLCNSDDRAIYAHRGAEFPALFRSFGGISVTKSAFVARIQRETGLSAQCAQCYGDAYICGWNNCKWNCVTAGSDCDSCLKGHACKSTCDTCTGLT